MTVTRELIDAIAADLDAESGLPRHQTIRYRRPIAILPEDCPLLVVWLMEKDSAPQTTVRFDSVLRLGVSWHEETVEQAKTLVVDEEAASSLMDAIEAIEARARSWATSGLTNGPDGAWELLPRRVEYIPPGEGSTGLTEGYGLMVEARITEE